MTLSRCSGETLEVDVFTVSDCVETSCTVHRVNGCCKF